MPRERSPLTLGAMMLFIAVVAVGLVNLRIVAVTHRDDVIAIWENWTGRPSSFVPPRLEWSDTTGPSPEYEPEPETAHAAPKSPKSPGVHID